MRKCFCNFLEINQNGLGVFRGIIGAFAVSQLLLLEFGYFFPDAARLFLNVFEVALVLFFKLHFSVIVEMFGEYGMEVKQFDF